MKNYLHNTPQLMVFAVASLLIIFSQTLTMAQDVNQIYGTWVLDWEKTTDAMTTDQRKSYNELSDEVVQKTKSSFSGRKFIFENGGIVRVEWPAGKIETGEWAATDDHLTITLSGTARNYRITIQKRLLTMVMEKAGTGAMFSKLILTR